MRKVWPTDTNSQSRGSCLLTPVGVRLALAWPLMEVHPPPQSRRWAGGHAHFRCSTATSRLVLLVDISRGIVKSLGRDLKGLGWGWGDQAGSNYKEEEKTSA